MGDFEGIIIGESLEDDGVLEKLDILSTRVEAVTEWHQTPWLERWTLYTVRIAAENAAETAEEISQSIDREHAVSWYADFKDESLHYVIFRDKVFCIDRTSAEEYRAAVEYGLSAGLPKDQADFVSLLE